MSASALHVRPVGLMESHSHMHMGETHARLGKVTPRMVSGSNNFAGFSF
jgi:hypothetical protein